ncbi:MAG: MBL fold metallo-hydrolase [Methanomassiliicoccus sp.]|nr:MAG: MBL fold metallo-hydrolase [Methanomassiliicoccus sp.]
MRKRGSALLVLLVAVMLLAISGWALEGGLRIPEIFPDEGAQDVPGVQGNMTVHFIDVGQGDSALIITPDGKNVLIDAGGTYAPSDLTRYISDRGVEVLDALVITHPHADHLSYADDVLETFDVRSVYHPGMDYGSVGYQRFLTAAEAEGCPVYTEMELDVGDELNISGAVTFQVLWLDSQADNANDASIVLKVSYGENDLLFTGDIENNIESIILHDQQFDLNVDVLKVSHHGSDTSTTQEFLSATTPEFGFISVEEGNSYGHPHSSVLNRLESNSVQYFTTMEEGSMVIRCDGENIWLMF